MLLVRSTEEALAGRAAEVAQIQSEYDKKQNEACPESDQWVDQ